MKLKSKFLLLFLLAVVFNPQSHAQTTETITKAEAQTFMQEVLWFLSYDWQNKEEPDQKVLTFFGDSLRAVLQKDERYYANRQGLIGAQISAIDLPWVELLVSTDYNDDRWNKKRKVLLKKENGRLFIVPKIQKVWRNTTVYLWKEEENITPRERTGAEEATQRGDVLTYLKARYPKSIKSKYKEKDFYGEWRVDSTFSYYNSGTDYAYAGGVRYNLKSDNTYTKTLEKLYSYSNETERTKYMTRKHWWMIWKDKMLRSEGKGVTILTLLSKSKNQFVLTQKNKEGKIVFKQTLTNLPKQHQVPVPIQHPDIEVIVQPKYDHIETFYEGKAVVLLDGKYGSIDTSGNVVIPIVFDQLNISYAETNDAFKDGKRVKIDATGKIVMEYDYKKSSTNYYNDRIIIEKMDEKMMLIDTFDNQIFPSYYDKIEFYGDRQYKVQQDGKQGLLLEWGEFILPIEYDNFWQLDPYLFAVQQGEKWGMWSVLSNKFLIPPQYNRLEQGDLYITAYSDGELQLLDKKTFQSIDIPKYDLLEYRGNNQFNVEKDGKRGIVDIHNKVVFPIKYDDFRLFDYEKNGVVKNGKLWGVVDQKGKEILPTQYEYLQPAYGKDYAIIGTEKQRGLINLKGDTIIPVAYEELSFPFELYEGAGEEWIRFAKNSKYGYLNLKDEVTIPAEYDQGLYFYDRITTAAKNGKYGIVNAKNEVLLDFLFDEVRIIRDTPIIVVKYKGYYGVVRNPAAIK